MTDPHGGPPRRASPRVIVRLSLALAGLLATALVGNLLVGGRTDPAPRPRPIPAAVAGAVPSSELAGEWSGDGQRSRCAGFDRCAATRSVRLTIDCARQPCAVTPFRDGYGSPPLRFVDGRYRATGPLPADVAPTCGGVPSASAVWRLELSVVAGRLEGSYAESTIQSFDCGATGVAWDVVLDRA